MNRHTLLAFGILLLANSALASGKERFEATRPQMGTLARIVVYAADRASATAAMTQAFERIESLNNVFSDYLPDSELNRLCRTHGRAIKVSPDLFRILSQAQDLARRSGGAFDITAGPIINIWRRARRQQELPANEQLQLARQQSGYRHLKLNGDAQTVTLLKEKMVLDLGGIAKGYAADEALAVLVHSGVEAALVALGGDIAVSGPPPGKPGWTIEIAAPSFPNLTKPKVLMLQHSGISTSGDAEQYMEIDGIRYSHIIDPRTGMALKGHNSVTIVARTATESDALATAVSVMAHGPGIKLVEATAGASAFIVSETGPATGTAWLSKTWPKK